MVKANLVDINKAEVAGAIIIHIYNIIYKVIEKKFQKIVNRLLKNKIQGLNSIINIVLRIVMLIIPKELAQVIINYLTTGLPDKLKKLFTFVLKKRRKKELFIIGSLQTYNIKKYISEASGESYYHICFKEGGSEAIINIKLDRRKKITLCSLSNKSFYLNYLDCVEGQAGLYSINTQP